MQRVEDIECNKCHSVYQTNDKSIMSVLVDHCFLSICPKCTSEVAVMMGFTPLAIKEKLGGIKRAQTDNNRLKDIEDGIVCYKCHKPFGDRYGDGARVREGVATNAKSWHLECYPHNVGGIDV